MPFAAPAGALAQVPAPAAPLIAPPAACKWLSAWLTPDTNVQLLVAAGDTIPNGHWPFYRALAGAVVRCAPAGASITIRAIADSPTSPALFSEAVPLPSERSAANPVLRSRELQAFSARAARALDILPEYGKPETHTNPLAPLLAAGRDLHSKPVASKQLVVMIFNGWWQTRLVNMLQANKNPATFAEPTIKTLRATGTVPDLRGTDVIIVGTTPGAAGMHERESELAGVRTFWTEIIAAGKGTLQRCEPDMPGVSAGG